ncbi:hypothetical protein Sjap_018605 [Stephania japonica]|uniref:Uncharacterized protein n=1 Tax=Stephania japonica TaxID=461633 RepID=A0AAP0NLQ4_9MAGN
MYSHHSNSTKITTWETQSKPPKPLKINQTKETLTSLHHSSPTGSSQFSQLPQIPDLGIHQTLKTPRKINKIKQTSLFSKKSVLLPKCCHQIPQLYYPNSLNTSKTPTWAPPPKFSLSGTLESVHEFA